MIIMIIDIIMIIMIIDKKDKLYGYRRARRGEEQIIMMIMSEL